MYCKLFNGVKYSQYLLDSGKLTFFALFPLVGNEPVNLRHLSSGLCGVFPVETCGLLPLDSSSTSSMHLLFAWIATKKEAFMSPLAVLTRRELNRIFLKVLFISTGQTTVRSKSVSEKNRVVVYIFGAKSRSISTITNSLKTWGLKGTLNKIWRRYYSSNSR